MNLCKKGIIPLPNDGVSITTRKLFLLGSDEDDNISKYLDHREVSNPNLIEGNFHKHRLCYTYTNRNDDIVNNKTNSLDIHILCRWNEPLSCTQLARSLSVGTRQKHRIRPQTTIKPYFNSECFDDIALKLSALNKWRSLSDPNIFARSYTTKAKLSDVNINNAFTNIKDNLIKEKRQNFCSNMDFILGTNVDVHCPRRKTSESQDVAEDTISVQVQEDLEALVLVDNSEDNKVEEMTCIPTQSLVDRSATVLLTPPSLSTSDNCIMCRLGCQHDHTQTSTHYGMHMDNFDKTNNIHDDTLTDKTTQLALPVE